MRKNRWLISTFNKYWLLQGSSKGASQLETQVM